MSVDTNSILYKIGEAVKAADAGTFDDFNSAFGSTSPLSDFDFKLQSLTDIDLEAPNTPEDGEVLAYNASEQKWVATAVAGGTGEDGDSAYEVWLRSNSGTEQDFLDSLKGADGVDGIQGPPGPQGQAAVTPAGLTWKGQWVSGTSYVINDTVGYDGASYFCINDNSGTTAPNASSDFALLAAQGADGIEGPVGPTGPEGPRGLAAPYFSGQSALGKNPAIQAHVATTPSDGPFYADLPDALIANYTNSKNQAFEGVFRLHWVLPRSGSSNYWEVLYRLEYTSSEFAFGFKLDTDGTFATSGVMANGANGANRNKPRTTHYGKNLKWFIENDRAIYMHGNNDGGGGGSNPMSVVTSASRVDGQSVGEMAFETDTKRLIIWDGTMWLSTKMRDIPLPPTEISATTVYTGLVGPSSSTQSTTYPAVLQAPSEASQTVTL